MAEEKSEKEARTGDWWGGDPEGAGGNSSNEVRVVGAHLYFYSAVNGKSILTLNEELKKLEVRQMAQAAENGENPSPIKLHIHSYGGSIFAGISGMEAIRRSVVDVHTIVDGAAASAATFLSTAGARRFMNRDSYMLIHQLSSGAWGKYEEFKDTMKNLDELMALIKRIYADRTRVPAAELDDILKHDLWFPSRKCLEYGLIDEIL